MDSFRDIDENDIPVLLSEIQANMPNSIHAYEYLNTIFDWREKIPEFEYSILAPSGDFTDASVCFFTRISHPTGGYYYLGSIYSSSESGYKRLEHSLLQTKRIDWNKEYFTFTSVDKLAYDAICRFMKKKQVLFEYSRCSLFWMPWQEALEVQSGSSKEVVIQELRKMESKEIDDVWPHKYPGSLEFIANVIEHNFGLGLFTKEKNKKLLSWCLLWFYGGLGVVGTAKGEERKGYSSMVVRAFLQRMGQMKRNTHLCVVDGNLPAYNMFKKLGFHLLSDHMYFVDCTK